MILYRLLAMAADVGGVEETALQEVMEEESDEDETEMAYPDTVIQLHHVGGDRYRNKLMYLTLHMCLGLSYREVLAPPPLLL